jgi:5-methylcytosine-specific restriction endonuclease McrA
MTDDPIAFAERLLAVLAQGSFNSTLKYATLLALIDLSLEHTAKNGAPPQSVTTRQLAEKVVALYWGHVLVHDGRADRLRQAKEGDLEVLGDIAEFRAASPASSPARARIVDPIAWTRLVQDVELSVAKWPLPRLHRVGASDAPFIFVIGWDKHLTKRALRSDGFDNVVRFVDGAAESLVRLAGLLRPLIRRDWAALVARYNRLPEADLEERLFGVDRAALARVREPLRDLQAGRCFYCARAAGQADVEVDHFIPWARHANDALENLVAAHRSCNRDKSDHLVDAAHVERWLVRNDRDARALAQIADENAWERDEARTLGVARGIYLRLPPATPVWLRGKELIPHVPATVARLFAEVT